MNARLTPLVVVGERISVRWERDPSCSAESITHSALPPFSFSILFFIRYTYIHLLTRTTCFVCPVNLFLHSWPKRVLDIQLRLIRERRIAQQQQQACVSVCSVAKFPVSFYHPLISITNALGSHLFSRFFSHSVVVSYMLKTLVDLFRVHKSASISCTRIHMNGNIDYSPRWKRLENEIENKINRATSERFPSSRYILKGRTTTTTAILLGLAADGMTTWRELYTVNRKARGKFCLTNRLLETNESSAEIHFRPAPNIK